MKKRIRAIILLVSLAMTFTACPDPGDVEPDTWSVYYDGNGATGGAAPYDPNEYEEGDSVTLQGPGTLSRTDYIFSGWTAARDGADPVYNAGDTFTMPGHDVTFYAKWTAEAGEPEPTILGSWYHHYSNLNLQDTMLGLDISETAVEVTLESSDNPAEDTAGSATVESLDEDGGTMIIRWTSASGILEDYSGAYQKLTWGDVTATNATLSLYPPGATAQEAEDMPGASPETMFALFSAAEYERPELCYGFHFLGRDGLILQFELPMDQAALGNASNYQIGILGGDAAQPTEVAALGDSAVYIDFSNLDPPLEADDLLTLMISDSVLSADGMPVHPSWRSLSYPFMVDLDAAGFDPGDIILDSPEAGNVSIGALGTDPVDDGVFVDGFSPVDSAEGQDFLQVWAFETDMITGSFAGSTVGSPNDAGQLAGTWNQPLGPVMQDDYVTPIELDPAETYQYILSYVDSNGDRLGRRNAVLYSSSPVSAAPALTLEDTRVDVTVNFEYTGSAGPADCWGAVILTYSDGGPAFAGQSFYYNDFTTDFEGSITFDDPLVPVGEQVYAQIYFDADWSFSLSTGDSYYKHSSPISVDGSSVSISFDDTETCSAPCPDAAGGWLTADYTITLDEDSFAILARTDGSPTYADLADTNRYGTITTVDNTGGYVIGQFTYHPETENEGKYVKLTWSGGDFPALDELYEAYDTEQEAIDATTPTVEFSWASLLW